MKSNYSAWKIDINEFYNLTKEYDRLVFFVRFGVLAPSSHNSQPWKFKIQDNRIEIHPDFSRVLAYSDKNNRQLYLSLGCAAYNIKKTAECFGYSADINFKNEDNNIITEMVLINKNNSVSKKYLGLMLNRVVNRNKYTGELSEIISQMISVLNNNEISVDLFTNKDIREQITKIVIDATEEAMENKNFRKELSYYVKSNITKSKVGMPGFGMGIPTPISLIASFIIKNFNMDKMEQKKNTDLLLNHTPAFVVISTHNNTQIDWVKAGIMYQSMAIEFMKIGYNTNPMAAPIQIGEHYLKLKKFLKNTSNHPQMFFRLGKAIKNTPHSPRMNANSVIV